VKKTTLKQQTSTRHALRNLAPQEIKLARGGDDTDVRGSIVDTGKNHRRH
jgi:hypothetical protein